MTRTSTLILPLLLLCLDAVDAVQFRVRGHSERWRSEQGRRGSSSSSTLLRRASVSSNSSETLSNSGDISYYANLTLNQKQFSVLIDTGSSDLWVGGSVPNSQSTGKTATVTYVSGGASGPVYTADLDFLDYNVSNQAFILADGKQDGSGLIGLGPNSGSSIHSSLNNMQGDSVLDRIFLQNTSTENYMTILLGRSDDPTDMFPGEITIGEVVTGYENVTNQPRLPVTRVPIRDQIDQHWQTLLDKGGFIGPDGNPINVTSVVDGSRNLTVIFDSGFSLPQVPRLVSDSIYSRIPGSVFMNISSGVGEVWTIPCDAEVNITIKIGGVTFPIHPLDTSLDWVENGEQICIGSFQPKTVQSTTYDAILGMAFLRNAYMLVNYGNFIDGDVSKTDNPFVQLLPLTTDVAEAHADFVSVRLNGSDTTGGQVLLGNVTASGPPDPTSSDNGDSGFVAYVKKHKWAFIGGSIGIGVLLLGLVVALCCCGGGKRKKWMKGVPVRSGSSMYRQLDEPAPLGEDHYEYRPTTERRA